MRESVKAQRRERQTIKFEPFAPFSFRAFTS